MTDQQIEAHKIAVVIAQRQRNDAMDKCIDLSVQLELMARELAALKATTDHAAARSGSDPLEVISKGPP